MSTEWKCGKCGKEYNFNAFMKLKSTKMKEEDPNPYQNYGFTSLCECGYVFHKDKWRLQEKFLVFQGFKPKLILISSVFLELNHWGDYYETMIFPRKRKLLKCHFQDRYRTKEEAIKGHKELKKKLWKFKYKFEGNELIIDE